MKCTVEVKPEGFVITAEDGHYSVVRRTGSAQQGRYGNQHYITPKEDLMAELLIALGLRNEI